MKCHFRPARKNTIKQSTLRIQEADEDKKLKRFFAIEKSTFDCIKPLLTFVFMLNAGGIAMLFIQKELFLPQIKILCYSALFSLISYIMSFLFFITPIIFSKIKYKEILLSRIISYIFLFIGFLFFIISFSYLLDTYF